MTIQGTEREREREEEREAVDSVLFTKTMICVNLLPNAELNGRISQHI